MVKTFICQSCGRTTTGHPALSRKDNKSELCPACGMIEAIEQYENHKNDEYRENRHKCCCHQ